MTWIMYKFDHLIAEEFTLMLVCLGQIVSPEIQNNNKQKVANTNL